MLAYEKQANFAVCMQELFNHYLNVIVLMSDESHFHLNGSVVIHKFCYWAPQNPYNVPEKPIHSLEITVWSPVPCFEVIGP